MSGNRSTAEQGPPTFLFEGWMAGKAVELALVTQTLALAGQNSSNTRVHTCISSLP